MGEERGEVREGGAYKGKAIYMEYRLIVRNHFFGYLISSNFGIWYMVPYKKRRVPSVGNIVPILYGT